MTEKINKKVPQTKIKSGKTVCNKGFDKRVNNSHPEHCPTKTDKKKVRTYASLFIPQTDIATILGIDPKTLAKHYKEELDTGKMDTIERVVSRMTKLALESDDDKTAFNACKFILERKGGWTHPVEEKAADVKWVGIPVPMQSQLDNDTQEIMRKWTQTFGPKDEENSTDNRQD